jgi:hypothetical protein
MSFRPGTVSKILWHFTGGPKWDSTTNKQLKELKPANDGYVALQAILKSKQLRLGSYHEVVKVIVPKLRKYNFELKRLEYLKNHPVEVKSSPVCCVADIPLQHIAYHANRYGKIAIGFRREAVIKAGFNPVMYTLENTDLLNSIYEGYSSIGDIDASDAKSQLEDFEDEIERIFEGNDIDEDAEAFFVSDALDRAEEAAEIIEASYSNFLAYIKTFSDDEFDTIYCEREWRSTEAFNFSVSDIALIVLPRNQDGFNYYEDFLKITDLSRNISIAAWEDLIEH